MKLNLCTIGLHKWSVTRYRTRPKGWLPTSVHIWEYYRECERCGKVDTQGSFFKPFNQEGHRYV